MSASHGLKNMSMDMKDRVSFKNVVVISPIYFIAIGIFIIASLTYILGSILPFAGAKSVGFFIGLIAATLMFRSLRKTIQITFDGDYVDLTINRKSERYLKSDIEGFYSFDYRTASNYTVSICIYFKNRKRLDISDYNLKPAAMDDERKNELVDFIKAMERELGFRRLKENKTRRVLRLGYTWFSRTS